MDPEGAGLAGGHRPVVSGPGGPAGAGRAAVEAVWRIEAARLVGAFTRLTGDFALAEDVAQEALAEALVSWPRDGIPRTPAAWLMTVGRRRAIDHFRRQSALAERYTSLARDMEPAGAAAVDPALADPGRITDDVLALIFISCHPTLSREASVALTLRVVGGLTSEEIARAFLVPTATVQARITRAKKTLGAARVPFEVPSEEERPERLGQVLSVLYVIFTEGSSATSGADLIRTDLTVEATRLARVLAQLMPQEPEVHGLLALLELTAARFPARTDASGRPVLLDHQDRRRWDRAAIRRGRAALARAAGSGRGLGAYGLQAAIAECHVTARTFADTDWERIVVLYEALGRISPSPVVELNRAVAVAMATGPATALSIVDGLVAQGALAGSHLLPTSSCLARHGHGQRSGSDSAPRVTTPAGPEMVTIVAKLTPRWGPRDPDRARSGRPPTTARQRRRRSPATRRPRGLTRGVPGSAPVPLAPPRRWTDVSLGRRGLQRRGIRLSDAQTEVEEGRDAVEGDPPWAVRACSSWPTKPNSSSAVRRNS